MFLLNSRYPLNLQSSSTTIILSRYSLPESDLIQLVYSSERKQCGSINWVRSGRLPLPEKLLGTTLVFNQIITTKSGIIVCGMSIFFLKKYLPYAHYPTTLNSLSTH